MESVRQAENVFTNRRFSYIHEVSKGRAEAIDFHHVIVRRSDVSFLVLAAYGFLLSFPCSVFLFFLKSNFAAVVLSIVTLVGFPFYCLRRQVEKESVIIFPSLGVQLETVYRSKRTLRRFVPIGKILKPVLNECVTPVTCYWSLSLIVSGEEELLPVLKNMHPPVKILVPIWEALLSATEKDKYPDSKSETTTIPMSGPESQ